MLWKRLFTILGLTIVSIITIITNNYFCLNIFPELILALKIFIFICLIYIWIYFSYYLLINIDRKYRKKFFIFLGLLFLLLFMNEIYNIIGFNLSTNIARKASLLLVALKATFLVIFCIYTACVRSKRSILFSFIITGNLLFLGIFFLLSNPIIFQSFDFWSFTQLLKFDTFSNYIQVFHSYVIYSNYFNIVILLCFFCQEFKKMKAYWFLMVLFGLSFKNLLSQSHISLIKYQISTRKIMPSIIIYLLVITISLSIICIWKYIFKEYQLVQTEIKYTNILHLLLIAFISCLIISILTTLILYLSTSKVLLVIFC